MKHFTPIALLTGVMLLSGTSFAGTNTHYAPSVSAASFRYTAKSRQALKAPARTDEEGPKPAWTLGPSSISGDLDAPNGERWYYTGQLEYDLIEHEYYTEQILKKFSYTVYDSKGDEVGTVTDAVHYADDEARAVSCELVPVVTRNFFNTDDNYEIAVSLGINTVQPGYNRYRTMAYALGGGKEDGLDKPVQTIPSLIGDVVEGAPTPDGKDNFFITFTEDLSGTDDESEEMSFWDYLNTFRIAATTYGRATEESNAPRPLLSKQIPLLQLPGNQETCPFIISFVHDGETYIMYQMLAEPLWEEYNDPMGETVQRENNTLNIEFYKATPEAITLDYTTPVAVTKTDNSDIYATYFCVGDMRFKEDIAFGEFGAPAGKASLYITKEDYYILSDSSLKSYYVYDYEGKPLKTIATDTESSMSMSNIDGFEPQQVFIRNNGTEYTFSFVNLLSCEEVFSMSNQLQLQQGGDPLSLRANMDRTPVGDSYEYAAECSYPILLDDDRSVMQVAWLKADGTFSHMEYADMGTEVQYASVYIEKDALQPGAYAKDNKRAYMILIKHGAAGAQLTEELLVAEALTDPEATGQTYLHLVPDEKGALRNIIPDFTSNPKTLTVYYQGEDSKGLTAYTQVIYTLPLEGTLGVAPTWGNDLAEGEAAIYNMQGVRIWRGNATAQGDALPAGVYIVVTRDSARKISVK